MIEKNTNINKNSRINRIVQYSEDSKQINILDQRFYKRNGKYYPSVSNILNYFPKNQYFHNWLKETGFNSDIIAAKAASEGTQVHNAIENYIKGKEIIWIEENGLVNFSIEVWKMILKFAEFWEREKPELIETEYHLFSDKYEYAGTADLIVKLREKIWLLDIKTSNSLHTSYNLQIAAYVNAWNETHDTQIYKAGIIWLKALTRGEDKKGEKIQGEGWQLKIIDDLDKNFEMFNKIYDIFKLENPENIPYSEILPTSIKIK